MIIIIWYIYFALFKLYGLPKCMFEIAKTVWNIDRDYLKIGKSALSESLLCIFSDSREENSDT